MVRYRRQRRRSGAGRRGRRRGRQGKSSGMGTRAPHHSLAGASLGRQIGARGHRISYEGGGGSEIDRVTNDLLPNLRTRPPPAESGSGDRQNKTPPSPAGFSIQGPTLPRLGDEL